LAISIVLLGSLVLGSGCGSEQIETRGRSSAPIPVTVAPAVEKVVPVDISAVGRVEESAMVAVLAQVDGRVDEVHFEEGDYVEKGDLLLSLDRRLFEAALREAVARRDRDKVLAA
jgi:multidrug efflux pump subunit AcrA (membrane-fusion protein)